MAIRANYEAAYLAMVGDNGKLAYEARRTNPNIDPNPSSLVIKATELGDMLRQAREERGVDLKDFAEYLASYWGIEHHILKAVRQFEDGSVFLSMRHPNTDSATYEQRAVDIMAALNFLPAERLDFVKRAKAVKPKFQYRKSEVAPYVL